MKAIVVEVNEFESAIGECLLKIEKAFRDQPKADEPFRTVTYYVRELQARLQK